MKKLFIILIALLFMPALVFGATFDLTWNANPTEEEVYDYKVYYRTPGQQTPTCIMLSTNGQTSARIPNLDDNQTYFFSVTAINGEAAENESAYSEEADGTNVTDPLINNFQCVSEKEYKVIYGLQDGARAYIDRTWRYGNIPTVGEGAVFIKTAISDRGLTDSSFIRFVTCKAVIVVLLYPEDAETIPSWLENVYKTDVTVWIAGTKMAVYRSYIAANRTVNIGANENINHPMYTVMIIEQ